MKMLNFIFNDIFNHQFINESDDKGHGRIEQRTAAVTHDIAWLNEMHSCPGLKAIGQITQGLRMKCFEDSLSVIALNLKLLVC